jgi:CHAT domain-containing protein
VPASCGRNSYILSIRVLSHLRGRARQLEKSNTTSSQPILIVGMPTTPGADDLPNVQLETEAVQKAVDSHGSAETMMNSTLSDVRRKLKECGMVHFACHAFADRGDLSKSMLQLEDWKSNPLNVRALIQPKLKACFLAYISACETAMSKNLFLLEEGIHIAGGFHMAGVPHTISALWPISDKASVNMAEQFYRKLRGKDGKLPCDKAAETLRSATIEMRGRGWMLIFWGAYIHSGP